MPSSKKSSDFPELKAAEEAFALPELLKKAKYRSAVMKSLERLDKGEVRIAELKNDQWVVNEAAKKAILLYFRLMPMKKSQTGAFVYEDKIPLKARNRMAGVRAVPGAIVRKGAFVEPGAVLMPSYVNIGARVGAGTMVDTWATVGSCAQIGRNVHLAGGVGIGGVLEPAGARPVIIEDDVFVGSRCIVVEGVRVRASAVLGAGVVITASTKIIDVSGSNPHEMTGEVPARAVVIPGVRQKEFPAGSYGVPTALIIGYRNESTDKKVSLNAALRDFGVPV